MLSDHSQHVLFDVLLAVSQQHPFTVIIIIIIISGSSSSSSRTVVV